MFKLKKILFSIFNLLFPANCDFCKEPLQIEDHLRVCQKCIKRIKIINKDETCPICSHPLKNGGCPGCPDFKIGFKKNSSLFYNNHFSQKFLYAYKFNGHQNYNSIITDLIIKNHQKYLQSFDVIIPVILNALTLFERDYCQVLTVVTKLSKKLKIKYIKPIRKKVIKKEGAQHFKNRIERLSSTNENFYYLKRYQNILDNKKILIIDDIYTTGSTINAVANLLLENNKNIHIESYTFARSTIPQKLENE